MKEGFLGGGAGGAGFVAQFSLHLRGLRIKSSHRAKIYPEFFNLLLTVEKINIKKKRPGMEQFEK